MTLPMEFALLTGKVDYVRQVNRHEWSSSCPQCGGTPHGGEYPDRFRMWTNASGKNKVMGWCRKCSYVWFPDNQKPVDPAEFEKWRREQILVEERRKAEAEAALKLLRSQKIWEHYNAQLNEWAYSILDSWGICKENVAFWKLGLIKDYVVQPAGYHTPAISIPVWGFDGEVKNVKVRTLNPQDGRDRYRSLYKTGRDELFVARPDIKERKSVLLVEGEKKAMVCAAVAQEMQVVGTQTSTPSPETLNELRDFGTIYVCLDPDASVKHNGVSQLRRLVDILGRKRTKVIQLPGKVDDMILKNNLSLLDAMRYAR